MESNFKYIKQNIIIAYASALHTYVRKFEPF